MEIVKLENNIGKVFDKPDDILNIVSSLINNITIIDSETVGIKLNKNLFIYNEGHTLTINKGLNVRIAPQIHDNPNIDVGKIYNAPETLVSSVEKANKLAHDEYISKLRANGIEVNDDGTFNIENKNIGCCDGHR